MYYVVTKHGVVTGKTKKEVESNQFVKGRIDYDELNVFGSDYVVNMTERDIDFVQDKQKISQIMFQNFFKQDNSVKVFVIINIFLTFLNLFVK